MSDDDRAYRVLLAAISDLVPGAYVYADTCREAFDAAELTSAERSGAFKRACTEDYLRTITHLLDDGQSVGYVQIKTKHESGKGRYSMLYRRTSEAVPIHLCRVFT